MNAFVLDPRILEPRDWATVLFVLAFALVVVARNFFETRFAEYLRLGFSDKYVKVYRDSSNINSGFTIVLFLVQLVSLAFFVQLILAHFGRIEKTDWVIFIRVFTFLLSFILIKYLIEKIIATAFHIEEFAEQYNLQKVSYRTYIGLMLLPVNVLLFYNNNTPNYVIWCFIFIVLAANLWTYLISLKNYQNLLLSRLFYFILYLCALEIAPYYFLFYWFTKS